MNRSPFAPALTAALLMSGISASPAAAQHGTPAAPATAATAATDALPGRWEWATHTAAAGSRRYRLYVPSAYDGRAEVPLLVMLHGCTQDPDDFARGTRMNAVAEEMGFLVAYPEQTGALHPQKCWTWYDPAHQGRGGEPALVEGIAREVMGAWRVDPARVYVAGVSAGGAMAVNAAAAYPETFAAAASHSGVALRAAGGVADALRVMQQGSAAPAALPVPPAVPLLVIHGTADAVVRPVNAEQLFRQWTHRAGAAEERTESGEAGGLVFHRTTSRRGGAPEAELVRVEGLGHAWSGGSPHGTFTDARGPDASRLVASWLLAHRRGGR